MRDDRSVSFSTVLITIALIITGYAVSYLLVRRHFLRELTIESSVILTDSRLLCWAYVGFAPARWLDVHLAHGDLARVMYQDPDTA